MAYRLWCAYNKIFSFAKATFTDWIQPPNHSHHCTVMVYSILKVMAWNRRNGIWFWTLFGIIWDKHNSMKVMIEHFYILTKGTNKLLGKISFYQLQLGVKSWNNLPETFSKCQNRNMSGRSEKNPLKIWRANARKSKQSYTIFHWCYRLNKDEDTRVLY